ncbi:MAG TPA: Tox-REase-5 domain-containing protein [Pirellulales bacterium]|nr:Tox-REase-5 domain-containing protein [Pirellulales bacterium]
MPRENQEGWPPDSIRYQSQINHRPPGWRYEIGTVKYDGINEATGVLLEAKANYADFLDKSGQWLPWFLNSEKGGVPGMLREVQRQIGTAGGRRIEWHVMQKDVADAIRATFADEGILAHNVEVIHTALAP